MITDLRFLVPQHGNCKTCKYGDLQTGGKYECRRLVEHGKPRIWKDGNCKCLAWTK